MKFSCWFRTKWLWKVLYSPPDGSQFSDTCIIWRDLRVMTSIIKTIKLNVKALLKLSRYLSITHKNTITTTSLLIKGERPHHKDNVLCIWTEINPTVTLRYGMIHFPHEDILFEGKSVIVQKTHANVLYRHFHYVFSLF